MKIGNGRFAIGVQKAEARPALARIIEQLGYSALWIGGSPGDDLKLIEDLLDATANLPVATGIVNIWRDAWPDTAAAFHRIEAAHPGRFFLGIGVGHPELNGAPYVKPFDALAGYLGGLKANGVPTDRIVVAALGPRVLKLAAQNAGGVYPNVITLDYTVAIRKIIGPDSFLAVQQRAVMDDDPVAARKVGRAIVAARYLPVANYVAQLRRLGYSDPDLAHGGSDRLIDDLITHGRDEEIAGMLTEHLNAGADQVVVQVIGSPGGEEIAQLERFAAAVKIG